MGLSGSTDFSVTGSDILKAALRTIGVLAAGEALSGEDTTDGLQALNMLVKNWMGPEDRTSYGLRMWKRTRATLTLTAKNSFSLKASGGDLDIDPPVAIISALLRDTDSNDIVMIPMLHKEFMAIGNKTQTGDPLHYYYERQLTEGTLYLDMVPSDITKTIYFSYLDPIDDFDAVTDDPEFPQQWYRPLKFNLAMELAPEYGKPISQDLQMLAMSSLEKANNFYPEESNLYFEPGRD